MEKIKENLKKVDQLEQAQYSTIEQLQQLIPFANKLGLYDAADYLKSMVESAGV